MNKNKQVVPRLRFKDKDGKDFPAWEQRKFSDTFEILKNNTLSRRELTKSSGYAKNIHYGDILTKLTDCLMDDIDQLAYIQNEVKSVNLNHAELASGDIVIADTAEDQTVGKCIELVDLKGITCFAGLHTVPCRTKKIFGKGYLGHYMNSRSYRFQLRPLMQGIKVLSISKQSLKNTTLTFPKSIKEQEKIGAIFLSIERLVTLHQRKLEQLKKLKKSLLQKMFPKEGELYPELRFPGFTDAWEQRNFEDILSVGNGKDYKHLLPGDVPVFGTGGYMTSVSQALSQTEDAIGIGRKGTIDNPFLLKAPFWTVDTLFYVIPKPKSVDLNFLFAIFQRIDWKQKDESTGVPSLSKKAIIETSSLVPCIEEQLKIAKLFQTLERTITLHQRKLDSLKKLKQGLLQNMFV